MTVSLSLQAGQLVSVLVLSAKAMSLGIFSAGLALLVWTRVCLCYVMPSTNLWRSEVLHSFDTRENLVWNERGSDGMQEIVAGRYDSNGGVNHLSWDEGSGSGLHTSRRKKRRKHRDSGVRTTTENVEKCDKYPSRQKRVENLKDSSSHTPRAQTFSIPNGHLNGLPPLRASLKQWDESPRLKLFVIPLLDSVVF